MRGQDTYKEVKTIHIHNAVVRVFKPDLTEDEYKHRMNVIHSAASKLLRKVN